jgi:hypothetical protein
MEFDLLKGVLSFVEDDDLPMLAVEAKQNLDKAICRHSST